jgi:hypothetical protein
MKNFARDVNKKEKVQFKAADQEIPEEDIQAQEGELDVEDEVDGIDLQSWESIDTPEHLSSTESEHQTDDQKNQPKSESKEDSHKSEGKEDRQKKRREKAERIKQNIENSSVHFAK